MIINQIAAMSKNRVIGKDNKLPWHLPEDFKYFKNKTNGKILIMGRKTFESLPGLLPNRFHIVISRSPVASSEEDVQFVQSIQEAYKLAQSLIPKWPEEVFVIGGGEIYTQTLPETHFIYLTEIDQIIEGDSYFPQFSLDEFNLVQSDSREKPLPYKFNTYKRK